MKWKRDRERRRQQQLAERVDGYFAPLTLSPWRMRVAMAAQWLAVRAVRILLKLVTAIAKRAVVKETR